MKQTSHSLYFNMFTAFLHATELYVNDSNHRHTPVTVLPIPQMFT